MALDPGKTVTQYSVNIWDMQSGLPGNSVFAIQQTQDGYLWIGTPDGLIRFDGINFQLYNREKIPQLNGNEIRALYEDSKGTLWIGATTGGLTCFKGGRFTAFPVSGNKALINIRAINEDRWGNLWIGSFTEGLTCMSGGRFTTYTTEHGLPDNVVSFIHKDENGDLRVVTGAGIVKLSRPGVFQDCLAREIPAGLNTVCLYDTDTRELWIGTGGNGLFRLEGGTLNAYGTKAGVPHPTITYLYKDRMKNLWLGTDGGGLTRVRNGEFSTLASGDGLADGFVYSIYEDREDNLWVGTLDGGLHRLRDSKFTTYTSREGLAHDYVNCILEGRGGSLWIGTNGGLNRLKNGKATTTPITGDVTLDHLVCLFEDAAGYLWIGTWVGLHRFKDGTLATLTKRDGLSDNRISCIAGDSRGNTWVGTENGLNRFDNDGRITTFTTKQGLSSNFIIFIFEDSRGALWISTKGGLNILNDQTAAVYNPGIKIEKNYFQCAYEDNSGTLWFGTKSGLIRLEDNAVTLYTVQHGLVENYVNSILEDENGCLWLAGWNGISRVAKNELEDFATGKIHEIRPISYNETDGMKSRWCTGEGRKTRDGRLWFPTSVGVTTIDPNHIEENNPLPPTIIERLAVDGEPVDIENARPTGRQTPNPAELDPGKRRLEFYYTAVSFVNPQKIRFKTRLKGFDHDWLDMGTARRAAYSGLPPGHYTFEAMACNADGAWNPAATSFSFYLRPYFYQTTWFYILVAVFSLLAAASLYRFRISQLRAREKELSAVVELRTHDLEKRTVELEAAQQKLRHSNETIEGKNRQLEAQSEELKELDKAKSRFFANISHEFRTPLTLIAGPLEQILSDYGETDARLSKKISLALRNSQRLLGLINQLLDLSKIDGGKMKLKAARQNIIPFLKGILSSFEALAGQNQLDLSFHAKTDDITLYFDAGKLEEITYNLLINAIKFTPAGGTITVAVRVDDIPFPRGCAVISLRDTGIGIARDQLDHIFDRFYQAQGVGDYAHKGTGIGLALVRELVLLHRGQIDVTSREGENSGTEFVIRLPLGTSHLEEGEIADSPEVPVSTGLNDRADKLPASYEEETGTAALTVQKDCILVVEDNDEMRQYISSALRPFYRVEEAADGKRGIIAAKKIVPDLVISDVMMPGVDGYELCRQLKNHVATSHIPIVLLTAKASEDSVIHGLETGADDYVTKPFNSRILIGRVKNLIGLRRQLQEKIQREATVKPQEIPVSSLDRGFIKELQDAIETHLADPEFDLDDLANTLYMSRTTLYRKVCALTGEPPKQFIQSYRLKRSTQLLKGNYGNITEVAFAVGFSSSSYFTRCFREKYRCLPSAFRASDENINQ